MQKRVVELVKANKKAVTLAIGDGANDVGMIKGIEKMQEKRRFAPGTIIVTFLLPMQRLTLEWV